MVPIVAQPEGYDSFEAWLSEQGGPAMLIPEWPPSQYMGMVMCFVDGYGTAQELSTQAAVITSPSEPIFQSAVLGERLYGYMFFRVLKSHLRQEFGDDLWPEGW